MKLKVRIGGLSLKNPVMTASGTFGYGQEYSEFFDINRLGALVVKGISLKPMPGNPPPRICETACGMLNSIGLENVGLKTFLKEKLPAINELTKNDLMDNDLMDNVGTPLIVNILGSTPAEYVRLSKALEGAGVPGIELNVSCPNVKKGGIHFGTDLKSMARLVRKVREAAPEVTLIVKLSPMVSDIKSFAAMAEDSGADALSLINTLPAMAINAETRRPLLSNIVGGLSGPAIKPVALRMVWEASGAVGIPVIGMGGIMEARDAVEFLLAGATAVAVGTASFINPSAALDIIDGIGDYMAGHGIKDVTELIRGLRC